MMEKLLKFVLLPQDKANHGYYGMVLFTLISLFIPMLVAAVVVFVMAYLKEYYDSTKDNHTFSHLDALATYVVPVGFGGLEIFWSLV
jgi:uncharacterized membrane protein